MARLCWQTRNWKPLFIRMAPVISLMVITLHTFLITNALDPWNCVKQPDGTWIMAKNPSQRCFDNEWKSGIFFATLFSLVYGLILPCAVFWLICKNRKFIRDAFFVQAFGSLTAPYKPQFFFWEFLVMVKRSVYVLLVHFTSAGQTSNYSRFVSCFFLLTTFTGLDIICEPFGAKRDNFHQVSWDITAIILLICQALVFEESDAAYGVSAFFGICAMLMICFSIVSRVLLIVKEALAPQKGHVVIGSKALGLVPAEVYSDMLLISTLETIERNQSIAVDLNRIKLYMTFKDLEVLKERNIIDEREFSILCKMPSDPLSLSMTPRRRDVSVLLNRQELWDPDVAREFHEFAIQARERQFAQKVKEFNF